MGPHFVRGCDLLDPCLGHGPRAPRGPIGQRRELDGDRRRRRRRAPRDGVWCGGLVGTSGTAAHGGAPSAWSPSPDGGAEVRWGSLDLGARGFAPASGSTSLGSFRPRAIRRQRRALLRRADAWIVFGARLVLGRVDF